MQIIIKDKKTELLTKADIHGIFTEKVKEYLNKGFRFYFYSGTQGEVSKVCLTKDDKEVYIIYIDEFYNYSSYKSGLTLYVKRYEDADKKRTLWFDKGETIEERRFYDISKYDTKEKFLENIDDLNMIRDLQSERSESSYIDDYKTLPRKCVAPALKLLKKIKGYKSTKSSDIQYVYKNKTWYSVKLFKQNTLVRIYG